jgi:O-antigen/teichoic acid export membrane protein
LKNLLKRILDNPTLMTWSAYFVQFGNLVFILPLVLNKFSQPEQNIWFFLNFIMGIAMLADSGFGPTLVRAFSYFKAGAVKIPRNKKEFENAPAITNNSPNLERLKDLLTTSFRIYSIIGMVVLVFMSTGGVALTKNLMAQAGNRPDLWLAYALFVLFSFISVITTRWSSAIRGLDHVAFESRTSTFLGVVKTMIFIVLLMLNKGIIWLVGYMFIESLIRFWYLRRFVIEWFLERNIRIEKKYYFDAEIFHSIWRTTWNTGLTFIALYIIGFIDTLIVGQFKDSREINSFFITKRILTFVKGFSRAPFYANVQRIYSLGATKDFDTMKQKSSIYIFYSMVLVIGQIIGLALFGNMILGLFTDTRLVMLPIYIIMALTVILDFHSSFHSDIYVSTNHFPFLLPAGITGLVIGLTGIPAATHFGITGLVLVPFLASLIVNNWYPVYLTFKLTGWNLVSYTKDLFIFGYEDLVFRINHIFRNK